MRILIAEDDVVTLRLLEGLLEKWGYNPVLVSDGEEAWQVLQGDDAPRIALLDWMMPGRDGIELCREIRKRAAQPYTYILLLTAKGQKNEIVEGLEAGADDCLAKPFDLQELRARVTVGRRIVGLQEDLIGAREALRFQATHDPATGLLNRESVLDFLRRELARGQRERTVVSVVMADLDHFKSVNDLYGHQVGDAVLREAARRLRSAIRRYDAVGRYGGDEFLMVLPGCDGPSSLKHAERIRAAISEEPIETPGGNVAVTISLGVGASGRTGQAEQGALLRAADAALYTAKRKGRNRVEQAEVEPAGEAVAPRRVSDPLLAPAKS